jgi:hypothetical protein
MSNSNRLPILIDILNIFSFRTRGESLIDSHFNEVNLTLIIK